MPNATNITSPINIHGIGRSGTTLMQNILNETHIVQTCNEMTHLVFCCFRGAQLAIPSHDKEVPGLPGDPILPIRAVHGAMCAAYSSSKPSWSQKLGGIPNGVVWDMITQADLDFASAPYPFPYQWYWDAVSSLFPLSKNILMLRDYRDVVVSGAKFFSQPPARIAADMAVYFNLLAHPASRIAHIIRFETLVIQPEPVMAELFAYLGLQYNRDILGAMNWYAAPTRTRTFEEARQSGFSWAGHYTQVIDDEVRCIVAPALARLEARLGVPLSPRA
jgi:hypothetical protein